MTLVDSVERLCVQMAIGGNEELTFAERVLRKALGKLPHRYPQKILATRALLDRMADGLDDIASAAMRMDDPDRIEAGLDYLLLAEAIRAHIPRQPQQPTEGQPS